MAIFGLKKKKEETGMPQFPQQTGSTPIDIVLNLRQQGYDNNQIIQTLQSQGYDSNKIFDAMSQADLMGSADNAPFAAENPYPQSMPDEPEQMQQQMPPPIEANEGMDNEKIEELIESIINEKWDELVKNINKIIEWKKKTEAKVIEIEQQFKELKNDFNNLRQAIIGKVGEYDENILNVGTEIKAMEKVFQKILPTFTENVSELSKIVKGVKKPNSPVKK